MNPYLRIGIVIGLSLGFYALASAIENANKKA